MIIYSDTLILMSDKLLMSLCYTKMGFQHFSLVDSKNCEIMLKSGMLAVVVFTPYLMMFIYRNEILGFAQMEPNDLDESVFANSLIITHDDFANYQHNDNDAVPVAYGMWWAGVLDESTERYVLSESCGHNKIHGGAFYWVAMVSQLSLKSES